MNMAAVHLCVVTGTYIGDLSPPKTRLLTNHIWLQVEVWSSFLSGHCRHGQSGVVSAISLPGVGVNGGWASWCCLQLAAKGIAAGTLCC